MMVSLNVRSIYLISFRLLYQKNKSNYLHMRNLMGLIHFAHFFLSLQLGELVLQDTNFPHWVHEGCRNSCGCIVYLVDYLSPFPPRDPQYCLLTRNYMQSSFLFSLLPHHSMSLAGLEMMIHLGFLAGTG